tara:strand:- start:524 stop:856 length:333 start_codon:yes stop_codon:yes gene_type:complete
LSVKNLKSLIKEYLKAGFGGTYDPVNPAGTISNEKILADYVIIDLNSITKDGRIHLNIKVNKNIKDKKIKLALDKLKFVNLYFNCYDDAENTKNLLLQQIKTTIDNANIE